MTTFALSPETQHHEDGASRLPVQVWQHIFCYLPPATLGKVLRVCKLFHELLEPSTAETADCSVLDGLRADYIWRTSREMHAPPRQQVAEIDLWRLICSQRCQFCGLCDQSVQPVIQFSVVSCPKCLWERCIKKEDLISGHELPKMVLSSLPSICWKHADDDGSAPDAPVLLWRDHVDMAKAEFQAAVEHGTAAASTWLDEICSLRLALRDPWFRLEDFVASARAVGAANSPPSDADLALASIPGSQGNTENRVPCDSGIVEADKQADIERRASLLEPPIPLDTLRGLPAFQTALQVPQPLDDASWGQLLPRLLAQMEPVQDEPVKQVQQDNVVLTGANDHNGRHLPFIADVVFETIRHCRAAGVPTSMFAYIIIQQIAVQFTARFPKPITIGMIKNAFTVYKRLRDARELTEIHAHCRQCFFSEQTYSLSALTTHFKEEHSSLKRLEDWPSMMINPPRSNAISEIYARLTLHPLSANLSAEKRQAETPMQRDKPPKKIKAEPSDDARVPRPRSDGTSVVANEQGSKVNEPVTTGGFVSVPNGYSQQAGGHEIAGQPILPVLGHWQPQLPPATLQEACGPMVGQPVYGEVTPLGRRFDGVYYYTIPPKTNLSPYNGPWY